MKKQVKIDRKKLLAMIHIAAQTLFKGDRDQYEAYLMKHSGVTSCKALNDGALSKLVDQFKKDRGLAPKLTGAHPKSAKGGVGYDRPTDLQRAKLAALARDMGWNGLNDPALFAFVERTTHVQALRFLTRQQMSDIITGLEKWRDQKMAKQYAMPKLSS